MHSGMNVLHATELNTDKVHGDFFVIFYCNKKIKKHKQKKKVKQETDGRKHGFDSFANPWSRGQPALGIPSKGRLPLSLSVATKPSFTFCDLKLYSDMEMSGV